jgi:hypothetical protein
VSLVTRKRARYDAPVTTKDCVMLRDGSAVESTDAGSGGGPVRGNAQQTSGEAWRDVDRNMRRAARRRARLDYEELVLIREGLAVQVWRPLGMVSMRDYLENVFGYGPTAASERIRVAETLEAMPALGAALEQTVLPYSAVREISRIATRATEREWVEACRGKNLRQIEELLAEREPGDRPSSPRNPDLRLREVRWRVRPGVWAKLRTTKRAVEAACGERIDDSAFADAMCDAVMAMIAQRREDGSAAPAVAEVPVGEADATGAACAVPSDTPAIDRVAGRARYQVAVTICRSCGVARQDARGIDVALSAAELERALCDAEWLDERGHVKQDIPPATRRLVRRRDGDRCRVPGCRSAQCLDIHHIDPVSEGGGHEPENLTTLCGAHHDARHDGRLIVRGRAPRLEFVWTVPREPLSEPVPTEAEATVFHVEERADGDADADAPSSIRFGLTTGGVLARPPASMQADAALALKTLGYSRAVAHAAVDHACVRLGSACDLEALIRAALQSLAPS